MKIYSLISKGDHLFFVIECAHLNSLLNRQCNSVYDVNYVAMFSPQHEQLWAYTSFLWPGMANWSRMNIFFELPLTLCILYLCLEVAVLLAFWTYSRHLQQLLLHCFLENYGRGDKKSAAEKFTSCLSFGLI